MAVNFFSIPYLLRGFGSEAYGVYLLMYAAGGYIGIFQFGAGLAAMKFVAEAKAAGEDGSLREVLRHSAVMHFVGQGAAAAVLWFSAGVLTSSVFEVPLYYRTHAFWLLRAAAVGGFLAAGTQWVSSFFYGLQRFAFPSVLTLLQALLMPLGLVAVLLAGRGLGAAAVWYVVVQALLFAIGAVVLRAELAQHAGKSGRGRRSLGDFARYGFSFWPGAVSSVAIAQFDKMFVAGSLTISDLTYYAVPSGVLQRLQTLPSSISHVLMPVLSEASAVGGREEIARLYLRAARTLFALSLPAFGLLLFLMPQFLGLWLGHAFSEQAAGAARLLVLAQAFALVYHAPNALAGALGGGKLSSGASWAQALMCLALWPVLIPRYGIAGAAAGSLLAQALPTLYFLHRAHSRLLGLTWDRFAHAVVFPLSLPMGALLVIAWLGRSSSWTWAGFLLTCAAASTAYVGLLWRVLPTEDRNAASLWLKRQA